PIRDRLWNAADRIPRGSSPSLDTAVVRTTDLQPARFETHQPRRPAANLTGRVCNALGHPDQAIDVGRRDVHVDAEVAKFLFDLKRLRRWKSNLFAVLGDFLKQDIEDRIPTGATLDAESHAALSH